MATRSPERTDFLANVLVTAIEGGVGYWADVRDYYWTEDSQDNLSKRLLTGAHAQVSDGLGSMQRGWFEVTPETIARGIQAIKAPGFQLNDRTRKAILLAEVENDAGEIDSEAADCIVQAALFGKIIYG